MTDRGTGNDHFTPVPGRLGPGGGTCAIAPVRGNVPTVRAAAAVRARGRSPTEPGTVRMPPTATLDRFPVHLLDIAPTRL